jgi:Fe-S cluster biogenesis protein NfuA
MTLNNSQFQAHTERIERSLQEVNDLTDDHARNSALDLMQAVMDLHGAAMSRTIELLSCESGRGALAKLSDDPLLCGLLVLYGVHPLCLQDRVRAAIEKLRPQLQKLGTSLELVSADENAVRIKLQNSKPDAHASESLQSTIARAIREAAPEVVDIAIEGLSVAGFVPLNRIQPALKYETGEPI